MSPEQFRQLADLLPEPSLLVAADAIVLAANLAAEGKLGLTADAVGRPLAALVADPADRVAEYVRSCAHTRSLVPGTLTVTASGRDAVPWRCEGARVAAGDQPGGARVLIRFVPRETAVARFVALTQKVEELDREVHHRRRAEEELRESEQRFARFMQHLPGLAWIKDAQGRYVFANDAAQRAFGASLERLRGRTDDEVFPPQTAARFTENDHRAVAEAGVQVVETLEHPDGVVHHSLVSKFPIPGPDDGGTLIGGMAIDVTDRMRAEEALREADRRKDEFLAMLAHELRNPLAPITNALHILQMPGVGPEVVEEARAMMGRQLQHLVRLVDDLMDVSRIMRGKIELRKEPVDLADVLARAAETAQPGIDAHGHQLTVTAPAGAMRLEGDAVRLAQVFANLLNNAAKFTDRGGEIRLTAGAEGGAAVVRVRDNGVGIAAELLPKVFDLFVQGERTHRTPEGGLGVGLTIVKRLVELHGGTVEALSEGPGRGSAFVVRLPLTRAVPEAAAVKEMPARPRLRALVVDDNPDVAESMAMLLRLWGHDVRTAHGGPAALEEASSFGPDVVLLDIGMPGMSGYELAQRLRQTPAGRRMLLAAMTGYGNPEDRRRSAEAGIDQHLTKPVEPDILERLLAEVRPTGG